MVGKDFSVVVVAADAIAVDTAEGADIVTITTIIAGVRTREAGEKGRAIP